MAQKTIAVTGASAGIGLSVCKLFHENGHRVIAMDRQAVSGSPWDHHNVDVTDFNSLSAVLNDADVNAAVNCAGIVTSGSVLEASANDMVRCFEVNVMGCVNVIKLVLPHMRAVKNGSIVNIASIVSSLKGAPDRCAYATSKAAVIGLTKSVAADFVADGVRCNAVCPGTIDTPSLHNRLHATGDFDRAYAQFKARQPMGRLGTAEEVAALVDYLVSDSAAFTTGQTFAVDGGWSI